MKRDNNLEKLRSMRRGLNGKKNQGRFGNRSHGRNQQNQQCQTSMVESIEARNQPQDNSGRGGNNGTMFGRGRHQNNNQS